MNFIEVIKVIFYGIVEGITEWLPVSSTGHLILFESFWPMALSDEFMEMFRVVIQLGAILAVCVLYFRRLNPFMPSHTEEEKKEIFGIWEKVIIGCIPAGVLGVLFNDFFDEHFYKWQVVAFTLILYGVPAEAVRHGLAFSGAELLCLFLGMAVAFGSRSWRSGS